MALISATTKVPLGNDRTLVLSLDDQHQIMVGLLVGNDQKWEQKVSRETLSTLRTNCGILLDLQEESHAKAAGSAEPADPK